MEIRAIHTPPLGGDFSARPVRQENAAPPELSQPQESKPGAPQRHPVLTAEEQRYFEELFPGAGTDARRRSPYTDGGTRSSAASGTLIDRRV